MAMMKTRTKTGTHLPVVLVVAMPNSAHTARWLAMVRGRGIRFVLLRSLKLEACRDLIMTRPVRNRAELDTLSDREVGVFQPRVIEPEQAEGLNRYLDYKPLLPSFLPDESVLAQPADILDAITSLRPDLVHSLETQFAGYLCLAAKRLLGPAMPQWMLSSWGSDFFLYHKVPVHTEQLRAVAAGVDVYIPDGERDISLFRKLGFKGRSLPAMPASGGVDIAGLPRIGRLSPPSHRRRILVKGFHGWSGRALNIMSALHLAAPGLRDYTIGLLNPSSEVIAFGQAIACWDNLKVEPLPVFGSYRDVIAHMAEARIVIGLGISDGTPTVMLEAMSVGAFPIQGTTSTADEWLVSGRSGFLVSPHDVAGLAEAILRAATDDALVDGCVAENRQLIEERWNLEKNAALAIDGYRSVLATSTAQSAVGESR